DDQRAAVEELSVLRTKPSIISGAVYTTRGVPFATYANGAAATAPRLPRTADGIVRKDGRVELFLPITLDGERVGTVYIAADQRDLYARMREDAQFMTAILVLCLTVALILSSRL